MRSWPSMVMHFVSFLHFLLEHSGAHGCIVSIYQSTVQNARCVLFAVQAVLVELNTTHYIIEIQTVYYVDVRIIQNYPKDPVFEFRLR